MQVDALIKELLATGSMNEETTADLNRWLEESAAGTLDPDDAQYIAALHAKLTGAPPVEVVDTPAEPVRIDGLTIEVPLLIENTAGGTNSMARGLEKVDRLLTREEALKISGLTELELDNIFEVVEKIDDIIEEEVEERMLVLARSDERR